MTGTRVVCKKCGNEFDTEKDPNAEKTNDKPKCRCGSRDTMVKQAPPAVTPPVQPSTPQVVPQQAPAASPITPSPTEKKSKLKRRDDDDDEERGDEEEETERPEDDDQEIGPVAPGDIEGEIRVMRKLFSVYRVRKELWEMIVHQFRVVEQLHNPQNFFNMLTAMGVHPQTAQFLAQAFFATIKSQVTAGPVVLFAPGQQVQPTYDAYGRPVQQQPGYAGAQSVLTQEMFEKRLKEEREAWEEKRRREDEQRRRDEEAKRLLEEERKEKRELRERMEKLERGETRRGQVVIRRMPVLGPDGKLMTDERGAPIYQVEEMPLQEEAVEERLVRVLAEKGVIGGKPQAGEGEKAIVAAVDALKKAVEANKPPAPVTPPGPSEAEKDLKKQNEDLRAGVEKERDARVKAELEKVKIEKEKDLEVLRTQTQGQIDSLTKKVEEVGKQTASGDQIAARITAQSNAFKDGANTAVSTLSALATPFVQMQMQQQQIAAAAQLKQLGFNPEQIAQTIGKPKEPTEEEKKKAIEAMKGRP